VDDLDEIHADQHSGIRKRGGDIRLLVDQAVHQKLKPQMTQMAQMKKAGPQISRIHTD
jgi:hypothetical protein